MSTEKQNLSFFKLYSFYKGIPEEFLINTNVVSYFYRNVFDISESQHRVLWVVKGSNKKSFAIKLFLFCNFNTQPRYILQEEVNKYSRKKSISLVNKLRVFLKIFVEANKCLQFPLPKTKPKLRLVHKFIRQSLWSLL